MCRTCSAVNGKHLACCPDLRLGDQPGLSRRDFLGVAGGGGVAGLMLTKLSLAGQSSLPQAPPRKPLVVKPILTYRLYSPRPQTSWRPWGGIHSETDLQEEIGRIHRELEQLRKDADFPLELLPLAAVSNETVLANDPEVQRAQVLLVFAYDGNPNAIRDLQKDTIFFVRHESGPVYLHYEIIIPRFLRQHTDTRQVPHIDYSDVVVDDMGEVLWRLRALCGLRNAVGTRIIAVGGPGAWAHPFSRVEPAIREKWQFDIQPLPYEELARLIREARNNQAMVALANQRTEEYLRLPQVSLECDRGFVERAFLLEHVFRQVMEQANCRAITVLGCMGTIMPVSETTACLPLSTLNDEGWMAFCESDFVVIPACILLEGISGKPIFFCNPTFPHRGIITLAHCTAPRKMDGKNPEPVRIVTHYESDYGAAPKVDMRIGQQLTCVVPDFSSEKWVGLTGEVTGNPFMPICRSQIELRHNVPDLLLAERMRGFHWAVAYGNYTREVGYALRRLDIQWDFLG